VSITAWPIVGRDPELAIFDRVLSSGEYGGLVIHGRAGVGKTRLAEECRQQAAAAGHPTERVTGGRSTALVPLAAVAGLLTGELGRPGPGGPPPRRSRGPPRRPPSCPWPAASPRCSVPTT